MLSFEPLSEVECGQLKDEASDLVKSDAYLPVLLNSEMNNAKQLFRVIDFKNFVITIACD